MNIKFKLLKYNSPSRYVEHFVVLSCIALRFARSLFEQIKLRGSRDQTCHICRPRVFFWLAKYEQQNPVEFKRTPSSDMYPLKYSNDSIAIA